MASTLDNMMAVYEGREGADLVFQPRLSHWYAANTAGGTLPEKYLGTYLDEIYKDLDVTPREVWRPRGGYLGFATKQENEVERWVGQKEDHIVIEYRTLKGNIREVERRTEHGTSTYWSEYLLKDLRDIEVYKYILEGQRYEWDQRSHEWGKKRFGDLLPLKIRVPHSPLMDVTVHLMGFKQTVLMLWRHPKEMGELMQLLEKGFYQMIDACKGKSVVEFGFGNNMHQDMCPPPYFKKYVIPFFERVMPRIHAMGMYSTDHWDGYVKQLFPLLKSTQLDGLECVTPVPQGDVTVDEMQEGMKGVFLRDGIPAVLFCPWSSLKELEDTVRRLIKAFYPRLILGVSDLFPANGDIERIRFVNKIVQEFNDSK